jgi:hypothetical protein
MASKIVWRPKVSLCSDGILTHERRRLADRLPAAALLLSAATIAIHSGYTQLVGSSETLAVPARTYDSVPQATKVAANPFSQQPLLGRGFPIDRITDTIGDPSGVLQLPAAADFDVRPTGTGAPSATTEQPNAASGNRPAAKPRAVRKKPALSNNSAPAVASTNGPQIFAWLGWNRSYGQPGVWGTNLATDRRRAARP